MEYSVSLEGFFYWWYYILVVDLGRLNYVSKWNARHSIRRSTTDTNTLLNELDQAQNSSSADLATPVNFSAA